MFLPARPASLSAQGVFVEGDLRTNWFIVVQANGKWWVDNEGHTFGPFPSREVAALEAVEYARRLGDPTRGSQVYWPDETGKMRLVRELTPS